MVYNFLQQSCGKQFIQANDLLMWEIVALLGNALYT